MADASLDGMHRHISTRPAHPDAGDIGWTVLRVVIGVVFMAHGFLKMTDIGAFRDSLESLNVPIPAVSAWAAALAEFLGGMGLFFGFWTRIAALAVAIVMVTAIATVHAGNGLMARNGGFEVPLVFLAIMVFFMTAGAGPYSMDSAMRRLYTKHRDVPVQMEPPEDRLVPAES